MIQASKLSKLGSNMPRASLGHCAVNNQDVIWSLADSKKHLQASSGWWGWRHT